jgi:hypothetical protein
MNRHLRMGAFGAVLGLSSAIAQPTLDEILGAIEQSFSACMYVQGLQRDGSQFRFRPIPGGNLLLEFDLTDMQLATDLPNAVNLECGAPGCVAIYQPLNGKWILMGSQNTVNLSCTGAGRRITRQLQYFYSQSQ